MSMNEETCPIYKWWVSWVKSIYGMNPDNVPMCSK